MAKPRRFKSTPYFALGRPKVQNAANMLSTKVEIRRKVLDAVGHLEARVFDAYAGRGELHKAIWNEARSYVGCDFKFWIDDDRTCFVGDNRRVMRSLDLREFNLFDLDAYGSPWEQALILAGRRKVADGETVGVVITEGSAMTQKLGKIPLALKEIAGIKGAPAGLMRENEAILDAAVAGLARRMGARIAHQWRAVGKTGAKMRYIGVVLRPTVEEF